MTSLPREKIGFRNLHNYPQPVGYMIGDSDTDQHLLLVYAHSGDFYVSSVFGSLQCLQGEACLVPVCATLQTSVHNDSSKILYIAVPKHLFGLTQISTHDFFYRKVFGTGDLRALIIYSETFVNEKPLMTQQIASLTEENIFCMASMILKLILMDERKPSASKEVARAAKIAAIKRIVLLELSSPELCVSFVASCANITTRYIRYLFSTEGTTFTDYVLNQRLELAYRTLSDHWSAKYKISDVALNCGFNEVSYFNRTFRKKFKMTPSQVIARHSK